MNIKISLIAEIYVKKKILHKILKNNYVKKSKMILFLIQEQRYKILIVIVLKLL